MSGILGRAGVRLTQRHLALRSASTAGTPKLRAVASAAPHTTPGCPKRFKFAELDTFGRRGMASKAGAKGKQAGDKGQEEDHYQVCTWSQFCSCSSVVC